MKQITFSNPEHALKRNTTKKERFLAAVEQVIPFERLMSVIEPYYPKTGMKC